MIKKILITTVVVALVLAGAFQGGKYWLKGMLPAKEQINELKQTQTEDLDYITQNVPDYRGKILAVVTSVDSMGENKRTGYEHTELARAYWVFVANGFEVDIASIKGGKPPQLLDGDDMGAYDYAFLNDKKIQAELEQTIAISDVEPLDYKAVYFVGGKGTMFDFPDNPHVQNIAKTLYQNNGVVSAVCHGPVALVNVKLDNGEMLVENKQVSGFTNDEELFLIPEAEDIFPFLLENKLKEQGAQFIAGHRYLEQAVQDGKLITGQNPWSVWAMAEMVIKELGYEPKHRMRTTEENTIDLLLTYNSQGYDAAKKEMLEQPHAYQSVALLMRSIIAFMEFDLGKGFDLLRIANYVSKTKDR